MGWTVNIFVAAVGVMAQLFHRDVGDVQVPEVNARSALRFAYHTLPAQGGAGPSLELVVEMSLVLPLIDLGTSTFQINLTENGDQVRPRWNALLKSG